MTFDMVQLFLFDVQPDYRHHRKYRDGVFKTRAEIREELRQKGRSKIYHVLSFGGGTQSAHLLEQHLQGQIHYDFIIFSDTGAEPQFIHDQVEWWRHRQRCVGNTTPFIITHHSGMDGGLEEMLMRYILTDYQRVQMPVYCSTVDPVSGIEKPAGMMPRQCTVDFKIVPVKQAARRAVMDLHGLRYQQKFPDDIGFIIDIGFSYDEIRRINTYQSPQFKYMYLSYPLVEENITTEDSIRFLKQRNFPTKRSRCYLCPFNCANQDIGMDWEEIIESEPLSFLKACWFDEQIRRSQMSGTKIMRSIPYLHYSRQPLAKVFSKDYVRIKAILQEPFSDWLNEWRCKIASKWVNQVEAVNL